MLGQKYPVVSCSNSGLWLLRSRWVSAHKTPGSPQNLITTRTFPVAANQTGKRLDTSLTRPAVPRSQAWNLWMDYYQVLNHHTVWKLFLLNVNWSMKHWETHWLLTGRIFLMFWSVPWPLPGPTLRLGTFASDKQQAEDHFMTQRLSLKPWKVFMTPAIKM